MSTIMATMGYLSRTVRSFFTGIFALTLLFTGLYIYQHRWEEVSGLPILEELTDAYREGLSVLGKYSKTAIQDFYNLEVPEDDATEVQSGNTLFNNSKALTVQLSWDKAEVLEKLREAGFSKGKMRQAVRYVQYIDTYKNLALRDMYHSKVPASIKLAQGLLESAAGQSNLTRNSNNHFGIKARHRPSAQQKIRAGRSRDLHDGDFVVAQPAVGVFRSHDDNFYDRFEVYGSSGDSYSRHTQLLTRNCTMGKIGCYGWIWQAYPVGGPCDIREAAQVYEKSSGFSPGDFFSGETTLPYYAACAAGLRMSGYATSKRYHKNISYIIETYELWRLDFDLIRAIQ